MRGTTVKHDPPKGCTYGKACTFAHSIRKMQAPGGYQKNQPLPPDAPKNLAVFHCRDWGSGHLENPLFEFPFESTFPTKITRHILQIMTARGDCMDKSAAPKEQPFHTILCHSFTFYRKCTYWQNCNYLHVDSAVIKERCQRYKCQVNGSSACCKFKKCPYAHSKRGLTLPTMMNEPAFDGPDGECLRHLTLATENEVCVISQFDIKQKYIANTGGRNAQCMCNQGWCTTTDEAHCVSVHLLPAAWIDGAFENLKGVKPPVPTYFQKHLPRIPLQSQVPNCWSKAAGSTQSPQQTSPASPPPASTFPPLESDVPSLKTPSPKSARTMKPRLQQGNNKQPIPQETAACRNLEKDYISIGSGQPPKPDTSPNKESPSPSTSTDLDAKALGTDTASGDLTDFLSLLDLPAFKDFTPTKLEQLPDFQSLLEKWDDGVSPRFNAHYQKWLSSGQMNKKFLEHGVLTHAQINSIVGEGFAASVWLGITVSDGREVALKVFRPKAANDQHDKNQIDRHFRQEIKALKRHGGLPGTVQYLGSFQWLKENEDEGLTEYQNVVILELMEGTLQEAVTHWGEDVIGSVGHLRLVRYVLGSMLDVLGQLNHGQYQSLVHRDVKPDNIMVDRYKNIRLIDFGISRVVDKVKEATKVSKSDGTAIYTSPEAQQQLPEAHITSDLYSLGMVVHFLLIGRDPFVGQYATVRAPQQWAAYHRVALEHLHKELVESDPNERAMNRIACDTKTSHHRILLAHPFFWTARKGISFLVALGNFTAPIPGLSDKVSCCYSDEGWFPSVKEFESAAFPVSREDKTQPWGLLRFIRNQFTHATDQGINHSLRHPLVAKPVILKLFPRLVLECWIYLMGHIDPSYFPTLASYLRTGWDVQAIRSPEEPPDWS